MKRGALKALKPIAASEPAKFVVADAEAIQAVMSGMADDEQQRRAMKWVLESACGLPVWAYRDSPRETDIALGRQFVGQQIIGLSKVNISEMRRGIDG